MMKKIYCISIVIVMISSRQCMAQNVGIGTNIPAEKLTVAGNVMADAFKFTAPKVSYYSVNEAAFKARDASETVYAGFGNGGAYITNGTTNYGLHAPVNLPHGAKVISITAQFYDASVTQDLTLYFDIAYTSGYQFLANISSSGSAGLAVETYTLPAPVTIDNSAASYEIVVVPTTGVWNTQDIAIRSVIFKYTLDATN